MDFIKSNLWNTWKNMLVIKLSILLRKIVFLFLYQFYFRFPAHFGFENICIFIYTYIDYLSSYASYTLLATAEEYFLFVGRG